MSARILGVGTAVPTASFTQIEIARKLGVRSDKNLRFFSHPHIERRHLLLPKEHPDTPTAPVREETPGELRQKFLENAPSLSREALTKALSAAGVAPMEIDFIACVTSTGFIVPGLSALLVSECGLRPSVQRLDIVGMGCNAGLNGLQSVNSWCTANPGKVGVLVCCELVSCVYSMTESENTSLVNSLFGDGIAAAVVKASKDSGSSRAPELLHHTSYIIPSSLECLRFDWEDTKTRNSFFVDKRTPEALAGAIENPLREMLEKSGLKLQDIKHWVVHSGGAAILDAISKRLGLPADALRHTRSVLRDFGNISSGSFLFSYQRLLEEEIARSGDYGLCVTMGPGLTIEMGLLRWS